MTAVLDRTGSSLGTYEELSAQDEEVATRHTPVREVGSASLRAVLAGFDSALGTPMAPMWTFVRTQPQSTGTDLVEEAHAAFRSHVRQALGVLARHRLRLMLVVNTDAYPANPASVLALTGPTVPPLPSAAVLPEAQDIVKAVRRLEGRLGLTARDVCEAAGISRSAFYNWAKTEGPRPRVPSQGRLWALVQLVDDLEELLEAPPVGWLLANEAAKAMLIEGRFDDVAELVRAQSRARFAAQSAPEYARLLAVGADRLDSDSEPPAVPARPRRVSQAQSVKPGRRKK
jgi:transcriptional regulator with XRE-family HTH domain